MMGSIGRRLSLRLALVAWLAIPCAPADDQPSSKDLVYRTVAGRDLLLDLYAPQTPPPPPAFP